MAQRQAPGLNANGNIDFGVVPVGADAGVEPAAWATALRERARPLVIGVATRATHYGRVTRAYTTEFDADAWFAIALAAGGAVLAAQVYLLAAQLAGDLAWRWTSALAPTWALDAVLALYLSYYIFVTVPEDASDAARAETHTRKLQAFAALVVLAMAFAFELMLAQRADGATHSFYSTAGPAYAGAGVVGLYGLYHLYLHWPEDVVMHEDATGALPLYVG